MIENKNITIVEILIQGLVQGVGFRPFVYRLAQKYDLKGWVKNQNDGVKILACTDEEQLVEFVNALKKAPPPAILDQLTIKDLPYERDHYKDFSIRESVDNSDQVTVISPDIGVCDMCLKDIQHQFHRIYYPLVNCTHCGPRFSIIKDLPYDRKVTTMADFPMCPVCATEYQNLSDRRFHAQPIACNDCGPRYRMSMGDKIENDFNLILNNCVKLIKSGGIVAIKGQGGYHLSCNAFDETAVQKLRKIKLRDRKPFAVMFASVAHLKPYVRLGYQEEELLNSWRRPIILAQQLVSISNEINDGLGKLGVMLPYMPFHYLLFERLELPAIVLTSGNISANPIIIDDDLAWQHFGSSVDAVVSYNREIYNRTDDSVVMVSNGKARMIRRSRGYVPLPVKLQLPTDGIIAAGAELNNCFCVGKGYQAYLSQHIGDLKNWETYNFYTESLQRFLGLFRIKPDLIVHDMHPDYLSTRFAMEYGLSTMAVQHHHAHMAACMAEYGLDEKVIGVIMDGTGYGEDGNIWGAEFLTGDLLHFERSYHFQYLPLPGSDKAVSEPWRSAVAYLWLLYGKSGIKKDKFNFLKMIPEEAFTVVIALLDKNISCPLTSSAGRLFDAVAALLNICTHTTYHAEAPMRLESLAIASTEDSYEFNILNREISLLITFTQIIEDLEKRVEISIIATKFHNTIVNIILQIAMKMRSQSAINKVVLSGGLFQNNFILSKLEKRLELCGFEIFSPQEFPANDGGIALGQMLIAAKRRLLCV